MFICHNKITKSRKVNTMQINHMFYLLKIHYIKLVGLNDSICYRRTNHAAET